MLQYNPTVSGSLSVTGTIQATQGITGSFSGSVAGFPTDVSAFSASLSTRITATESTSSAYVTASGSFAARISSNEARTGSFASTGSNQFNGSQFVTGSLTATGTIVAQTLVVQTITSSIDFVTGSTRFGSITANNHQFTGSVLVSGSGYINGNVGIGITNPNTRLQVASANTAIDTVGNMFVSVTDALSADVGGQLTLGGVYNSGGSLYAFGGIAARKENATSNNVAGYLQIMTTTSAGALTERIRITSTGNIGIGTTDPQTVLNNFSTSARGLAISNLYPFVGFNDTDGGNFFIGTQANLGYIWNAGTDALILATNNAERMQITSGGNVGIGTNSPGKRLELSEDNSSTSSTTGLRITNWNATTDSRAGITFQNYDNVGAAIWSRRTGSTAGHLVFGTNSGTGTTAESAVIERMRIDNAGKIGIGTTSPSYNLSVNSYVQVGAQGGGDVVLIGGGSGIGAFVQLRYADGTVNTNLAGNGNGLLNTTYGNVLIGTTSDNGRGKLQVNGNIHSNNVKTFALSLQGVGTPVSTGLSINGYGGGRTYLLITSQQWDAGNSTSSAVTMIRCGYDGNNFSATVLGSSNLQIETWSQSGGILYVAGYLNFQINITVLTNN